MAKAFSKTGRLWIAVLALAVAGCHQVVDKVASSPLRPVQMTPKSCVLEVFFVRFPYGDAEANGPMWQEIDEQQLAADLRNRLALNGFRVGHVGTQLPESLSKLLELKGKAVPNGKAETEVRDLTDDPRVERSHWQLPPGQRKEIICSDVFESLPVLICGPEGIRGDDCAQAQGVLSVESFPERDGRVRLRIVPEIQHGAPGLRYVGRQGMVRLETGRSKRVLDSLSMEATLSPGQMLVFSGRLDRPATLGHRFFTPDRDGRTEQKLLVIRLAQTQHDDLFDAPEVLTLDLVAGSE
jgi:hypothetical protein